MQTREGSLKAVAKILAKNPNHFKEIGRRGGLRQVSKGFGKNHALAVKAGAKGGTKSRRGKNAR